MWRFGGEVEAAQSAWRQQGKRSGLGNNEGTEQAGGFVVRAGGEVEGVGGGSGTAVARKRRLPEPVDDDRVAQWIIECADEGACGWVVSVDEPVAEIAHEEVIGEFAEISGREGKTPRRVKIAVADEALKEITGSIVDIHEAIAGSGDVVFAAAFGVGHIELSVYILDAKRGETGGEVGVGEIAAKGHGGEGGIKDIDITRSEVSGIDVVAGGTVVFVGEAFIDGTGRVVDF